jgi:ComF family protein
MNKLLNSLSHLVFPNLCVCCDGYLTFQEEAICDLCYFRLPRFENYANPENSVAKKLWGRLPLVYSSSYLQFNSNSDVRKILHEIKYKGNRNLGIEMGKALGRAMLKIPQLTNADIIIPIPLHPKRELERGYNQSNLIAHGMSEVMGKHVYADSVVRKKYNSTQTSKKRYERFINSNEIFKVVKPQLLENKHAILIDDVITTGATIEACGNALLEIEGLKLSVVSLAAAIS